MFIIRGTPFRIILVKENLNFNYIKVVKDTNGKYCKND